MNYKKYLEIFYEYLFLIFCLIVPFEEYVSAIPNILIGVLLAIYLVVCKKNQFKYLFKNKSYIVWLGFVLYIFLIAIFNNRVSEDFFILKKLLLPVIIVLLGINVSNFNRCKLWFIAGTVLSVLISFIGVSKYWFSENNFNFTSGDFINQILVSERIYIGFCVAISLVFLLELFKNNKEIKVKILCFVLISLLLSFCFIIAARIAIVCIVYILILFFLSLKNVKIKFWGIISFIIFIGIFFMLNKNLTNRFFHSDNKYHISYYEKVSQQEPRVLIWSCAYGIFKNNFKPFLGNGFYNIKNQLVDCYDSNIDVIKKRNWYVERSFNSHNQYIDFLLSSGWIGIVLFLLILYLMLTTSKISFYTLSLLGSVMLILLIENIFHRQIGCYLFSLVWISLLKNGNIKFEF
ncbi:hypothetical protein FNB79_04310 [Formosa sediminum]|uniref:O-antigen ligase-related domain-containing protein n=1 Tax=Formosa sediminum TaxID=2594004 RepID=A0A516GP07_9FLAO|nr:O-antigen ligase family protein [Formosa sediminum]QDO93229.1 hypothetical protein FNB79_04310 [Formosa sediminum]